MRGRHQEVFFLYLLFTQKEKQPMFPYSRIKVEEQAEAQFLQERWSKCVVTATWSVFD